MNTEQPDLSSSASPRMRHRMRVMGGLLALLVLVGINLAIGSSLLQFEKVVSESMEPALMVGDVLLADANESPNRYDVVCLWDPEVDEDKIVKRIIGLPGDTVSIKGGVLYLNGKEEYSEWIPENQIDEPDMRVVVPPDMLFVMGDNRNNSYDSVNFGPVPDELLRGVAKWIVWPPKHWGKIRSIHPEQAQAVAKKP